ncbi:hypothetical protein BC829DRAFT_389544 [Chytridium lagenaria]|nr:hypothetical protein BC829DRAFT_389544 [Chytridium lagenaria]
MRIGTSFLVVLLALACTVFAWDQEDFEIFDLYDRLVKIKGEKDEKGNKVDFYTILEISPSATPSELTKAYRKLSLTLHPDKNPDPKAGELYALLTSINTILKDEGMRERYDRHRNRGIPRWRGTGYFLTRYKPGVGFIVTFMIGMISFAQYLTSWVLFFQKKNTATEEDEDVDGSQITYSQIRKKLKRAGIAETPAIKKAIKSNVPPAEILKMISDLSKGKETEETESANTGYAPPKLERPKILDTLVFQLPISIVKFGYSLVTGKAFTKKEKIVREEFIPDYDYEEEDYDGLEEEVTFTNKGSPVPATPNWEKKTGSRPSEKLRQNRLKKDKKRRDGDEEEEEKKALGPGMIRSASGVVMSKQDFIKQKQKELAAGKGN